MSEMKNSLIERAYFDSLEAWDSEQDLETLIFFLKEQAVKTWRKQIDKTK